MDRRPRGNRITLQKEATLGFCLKEVDGFTDNLKDQQWKCPFCDNYSLGVPKDEEHEAWIKCGEFISSHLNAHRAALLKKATTTDLMNFQKSKGSNRARVWVSGTMKDRGYH